MFELPKRAEEFKHYDLSSEVIQKHIVAKYDREFAIKTLKYCKNHFQKGNVKNPSGYILKALEKGFYEEAIKKEVQKSKRRNKPKEVNKGLMEVDKSKEIALNKQVLALFQELSENKAEEYETVFLTELQQSDLFRRMYQDRKMEHPLIRARWLTFLKRRLLSQENSENPNDSNDI